MAYYLSPIGNTQTIDANGDPLVGGTISSYLAGTSTAETTYTDDTGGTSQGVVMTLNSLGYPTNGPVWMLGGVPLKFIIKNAAGVTQSTFDDISGIGDTATAADQWVLYGAAPTYISATSFSVVGDQTNTFEYRRRLKSSNSGGTTFSTIVSSAFAAGVTTVTVENTSGVLDSGMSQVSYGLTTAINSSIPDIYSALVVGDARNLRASLTANGASITFTADQVVVGESLTGQTKRLASYSQALNTATTGAGGMDTGALPTSGFLAVYAIAKPDGTKSILGVNATTSSGSIYSGANMPSGYTYSALIGIVPTNATPAMMAGLVQDRGYSYQTVKAVFTATTVANGLTSQSISGAVPTAARSVNCIALGVLAATGETFRIAADGTGTGLQAQHGVTDAALRVNPSSMVSSTWDATFRNVPIITAQTVFIGGQGSGSSLAMYVTGYGW